MRLWCCCELLEMGQEVLACLLIIYFQLGYYVLVGKLILNYLFSCGHSYKDQVLIKRIPNTNCIYSLPQPKLMLTRNFQNNLLFKINLPLCLTLHPLTLMKPSNTDQNFSTLHNTLIIIHINSFKLISIKPIFQYFNSINLSFPYIFLY